MASMSKDYVIGKGYSNIDENGIVTLKVTFEEYKSLSWAIECAIDKEASYKHRQQTDMDLHQSTEQWQELSNKITDQVFKK